MKKLELRKKKPSGIITGISVFLLCFTFAHTALAEKEVSIEPGVNNDKAIVVDPKEITQTKNAIKGSVFDSFGEPLIGVSVSIKGSSTGTVTDIDGNYSLSPVSPNAVIVFSYIGYKMQEVAVGSQTTINVTMREDSQLIDEIVVIGYGTQKKANLTGSVSTIGPKEIENRPVVNVSSALAGLAAGVSVQQTSGQPGADGAKLRIRGSGSFNGADPLVIVDGVQGAIDAVNPNDIESISILKDAASGSIYGSAAANGVILITTKKGTNEEPRVTYTGIMSVAKPNNVLEFVTDYATHMNLINQSRSNLGQQPIFSDKTISDWVAATNDPNGTSEWGVPNWLAYPNTDWAGTIFEDNQIIQNHNLSVSGGGKTCSYLLSGQFVSNPGIMQNSGVEKIQIRANVESKISSFLKIGTQTFASREVKQQGNVSSAFNFGIKQSTPGMTPFYNGKYGFPEAAEESATANNALAFLNGTMGERLQTRINTTWYAGIDIYKGIQFEGRFNYQQRTDETNAYDNPISTYSFRTNEIKRYASTPDQLGVLFNFYKYYQYTSNAILRYSSTFNQDHSIDALFGYERNYYNESSQGVSKKGVTDPSLHTLDAASVLNSAGGGMTDRSLESLIGRVNYGYKGRYLLEANFRYDGSSRFHSDYRWGFFPSGSAAWRISEEGFMEGLKDIFSNLKLRASYGTLGQATSGNYSYQATYNSNNVGYSLNGNIATGLTQVAIANPLLQWETTTVTDIGLDASMLNQRLSVELDWYNKYTDGILTIPPIHMTMGDVVAPWKNTASMTNKGFEVNLGWHDQIKDFTYSVSGNVAYNVNNVNSYKGKLDRGWTTDASGKEVYYTNLGDVSSGGTRRIVEDRIYQEYYMYDVYKGNGSYKNTDGTVNINGGPKNGMIRTPEDMQWLKDMQAAGYSFTVNQIGKGQLYYGDFIYADKNGDKIYGNANDQDFTGKSTSPKFTFGMNVNLAWKGIDFSMQWAGLTGVYYYWNENFANNSYVNNGCAIPLEVANNHYYYNESDPNDPNNNLDGKYPRLKFATDPTARVSTFNLYNGSYVKLKNLQIGYTLPKKLMNKMYINSLRVFLTGENLLTITKFPGMDPEINQEDGTGLIYPTMRQYAVGINLTF